jgi:hypothetical protein
MSRPRFLLDEHIPQTVQRQLRRWNPGIEVLAVGDPEAPPAGSSDPAILVWIEEHESILVTANRKTMPGHLEKHFRMGRHIPGLFLLRRGHDPSDLIETLYLVWMASSLEEYRDRTLFLPL